MGFYSAYCCLLHCDGREQQHIGSNEYNYAWKNTYSFFPDSAYLPSSHVLFYMILFHLIFLSGSRSGFVFSVLQADARSFWLCFFKFFLLSARLLLHLLQTITYLILQTIYSSKAAFLYPSLCLFIWFLYGFKGAYRIYNDMSEKSFTFNSSTG